MLSVDQMQYHPTSEKLTAILCNKTQNTNPLFFRIQVGYWFSVMASMMRCKIKTHDTGDVPVNMYALNLSPSGTGKGKSMNLMENKVLHLFRSKFMETTFPALAEKNIPILNQKRANRKSVDPDEELVRTQKEFDDLGPLMFSFSEATSPAIKQMRHKLLMAEAGALNLQIDEIGSNLIGNMDAFNTYLELYDVGGIKQKLIKSSSDSKRVEEIVGQTPANMLAFGTPAKLLDGGKIEEELYSLLETGYARRCLFGYSRNTNKLLELTAQQVYDLTASQDNDNYLASLAQRFENLADMVNVNKQLIMSKDTALAIIEYRLECEKKAAQYLEHEEIKKAELAHRYFKAMKLAGAYAFVDDSPELTLDHFHYAVKLVEESGEAFLKLLHRDKPYAKLAKFLGATGRELTQADLVEELPFYRGSASQKQEMMSLAIAYGYKNNILIKKSVSDSIEFYRGESLKEVDLNQMTLAYSVDMTTDYRNERVPFDKLHRLTQAPNMHWTNHHLADGYRRDENIIPGFDMLVLDIDKGTPLDMARNLMAKYRYLLYTTKRHTEAEHRFRMIVPMNFRLEMDGKEYKEFMANVTEWLPFQIDEQANQRARKWLTNPGHYEYHDGEAFDALPFIPKTSKNEERKRIIDSQQSMDNLERWMINNIADGNRNNMLHRYAMMLVDSGFDQHTVAERVSSLNSKLIDKLSEEEILATVLVSVKRAIEKRA